MTSSSYIIFIKISKLPNSSFITITLPLTSPYFLSLSSDKSPTSWKNELQRSDRVKNNQKKKKRWKNKNAVQTNISRKTGLKHLVKGLFCIYLTFFVTMYYHRFDKYHHDDPALQNQLTLYQVWGTRPAHLWQSRWPFSCRSSTRPAIQNQTINLSRSLQ